MADSGTAAAATMESSLLSKLESSSDLSSIHHQFSSHLQPFFPVPEKLKKQSNSAKIDAETSIVIRSLAKKFLSFLRNALYLLPKRLHETPKIDCRYAPELFETYKLCLNCLEAVSSQLLCKPHHMQIQRVRLINCYEIWGRYADAQMEGVSVLDFIGNLSGKRAGKLKGRIVPELGKDNCDKEIALLILEVVVTLVKCVAHVPSKKEEDYHRLLSMVEDIQPWLKVIGAVEYDKLHRRLVSNLSNCARFLVGELAHFDGNLTHKFCAETFSEYKRSSLNDQISKFAYKICSLLFSQLDNDIMCIEKILTLVLDTMANECKIGKEKSTKDFLELVEYCTMKCRNATADFCVAVATHFNKLSHNFSEVSLIMRLYAITLSTSDLNYYSRGTNSKIPKAGNDVSAPKLLLDVENQLQSLRKSITAHTHTGTYMSFYFNALKFLCDPVSELIIHERKDIICGYDDMSFPIKLPNIEYVFQHFRVVFDDYRKSEKDKYVYEDNSRTILSVAIAAFTLSLTSKQNVEKSVSFLRELISAEWVHIIGLKHLFASLNNVGIVLYRSDRLQEATHACKLSCEAAWNCVIQLSKMFVSSEDNFSNDLSEDSVSTLVTETCVKSAFLLEILHQCGSEETSMILTDFLKSWSVAQNLFDKIPVPVALIKQWVKIQCIKTKDPEVGKKVPTIYLLMSSFLKMPVLGILLEQELQMYNELRSYNPKLSKMMQTSISNILLEKFYNTKDNCFQKSRVLVAFARESRASGVEGLDECIKNLSQVISAMSDMYRKDKNAPGQVCELLAEAYCLHALCIQEAEPNSKVFVKDIGKALKIWLSQEETHMVSQNTLTLLYHVCDFLSLKGFMEDHSNIYEMMIRFFTLKNIPLKDCVTMLWQSRSLNHALCTAPVNDAFILISSQHSDLSKSKSTEFWISCMEKSKSLEVGFKQSFSVISTLLSPDSHNHDNTTQLHTTIDEIKHAASDLINKVPLTIKSMFLAAHLYFDLAERLVTQGSMIEALYFAKEAHRLRMKLFKTNFMYSIEQQKDTIGDNGETMEKCVYVIKSFHMHPSVATSAWSNDNFDFILTPWNVLRCYLESILQVGTIQEIIGNGYEAEALLQWGKTFSHFQDLPIFLVSFSSALGKLYRKQQLLDIAEKELESAKQILVNNCNLISCLKCKLILEVTVDQQLGDLYRSRFNTTNENKTEELSKAEIFYKSAVEKLKLSEWRNCVSNPKETSSRNTIFCDSFSIGENDVSISSNCENQEDQETIQPKVTRKGKKAVKVLPQEQRASSRVTRSSKQKIENAQNEVQTVVEKKKKGTQKSKVDQVAACGCEITCVCDEVHCWHCVPNGVMKSSLLKSIIQMKWECTRRRILVRLLIGIGKCLVASCESESERAHDVFLEGISVFISRSTFRPLHPTISFNFLSKLIERNSIGDMFAIEIASILYNISWFSIKYSSDKDTSNKFIPIPRLVSGLKVSFILCREVPELFQKVSRLLAVLYTLNHSNEAFSTLTSSSNGLTESQWASYFHQASLGSHLNYQLFSRLRKPTDEKTMDVDGSCLSSSASLSLHRLAPESVMDLEEFILNLFKGLPRATIVCISMLEASWLRELLPYNPSTRAWIMFSRLNSDNTPVVIILPIDSIIAESSKDSSSSCGILFDKKSCDKSWRCPWTHTIIDEVAPVFKSILEGNYISSSGHNLEDTKENRLLWWNQRRKLDQCLSHLLRDMEDLWFGPWKHLLLGELSDQNQLDYVLKKISKDLKNKCKVDVDESLIKSVIGASSDEECLSELILKKGCYIGGTKCQNVSSSLISELILNEINGEDFGDREAVILVPDFDIQMLPWESIPVLRNQQVYRMPSVASISCTYDRCCQNNSPFFPMIDPLHAYYLLNPGGDLTKTEAEFGSWFKDQNLQGTSGTSPSVDELSVALRNHDLFIYLGHGSGVQYIPGGEIQKLERCAATLLMGCSSGSLSLNGSYTPKGAPLYYLFAGSPVIIANLWDVTDKDIDRFGKAMLDAWIKARSQDCAQCTEISDKFKEMNLEDGKRKGKKKTSSKSAEVSTCTFGCKHRPKIGAFMGKARDACTLPFLIGAAPVCYGVPTGIWKKDI